MSFETIETANRSEWLEARRAGIGASDIAAIMGISPWSTPFQIWASKVAEIPEGIITGRLGRCSGRRC